MALSVFKSHQISCGHRIYQHESKCRHLHGHNYTFHFECTAEIQDSLGRIIDFGVLKTILCGFLEDELDHKFLIFKEDPLSLELKKFDENVKIVDFNPTAENIAKWVGEEICPVLLAPTGVECISIKLYETDKSYCVWKKS